jgi:hypothetical protein
MFDGVLRMRGNRKTVGLVIGAGILLRLRAVPPSLSDVDGVNFARALARFDPLHQAPHLPGYPVYVFATKLFAGAPEVWALVLPALIAFPIGAAIFYAGLQRRFGDARALFALSVVSFFPLAVLVGAWPGSDGFGFALLLASIGSIGNDETTKQEITNVRIASRLPFAISCFGRSVVPYSPGILFGLLLGVRLSWWPLAVSALILIDRKRPFAIGFALACTAWVLVLVSFAPPLDLFNGTLIFGTGHFTEWGLGPSIGFGWRLALALMIAGIAPLIDRRLAIAAVPYALWIALGQNLENPRHYLPLIPMLAAIEIPPLARRIAAPALFAVALALSFVQGTELPPAAAIARQLAARNPERLQVFAGESARVIEHVAPAVRVWRPASPEVLEREALAASRRGAEVLILSDAPGAPYSKELAIHALR